MFVYGCMFQLKTSNYGCEESTSYSFTACVRNSISQAVGCRVEWDTWTDNKLPVCNKTEQLIDHENQYFMFDNYHQSEILSNLDCLLPCSYKEMVQ